MHAIERELGRSGTIIYVFINRSGSVFRRTGNAHEILVLSASIFAIGRERRFGRAATPAFKVAEADRLTGCTGLLKSQGWTGARLKGVVVVSGQNDLHEFVSFILSTRAL